MKQIFLSLLLLPFVLFAEEKKEEAKNPPAKKEEGIKREETKQDKIQSKENPNEEWPPKETEEVKKLYDFRVTQQEIDQINADQTKSRATGDANLRREADRQTLALYERIARSDGIQNWTIQDYMDRVKESEKLTKELKFQYGWSIESKVWQLFAEWASHAKSHPEFFKRALVAVKNRGVFRGSYSESYAPKISQCISKYIDNHPDKFKDAKDKVLFCSQVMAGGIKEQGILDLQKMYAEELQKK